jgi:hypothetical protein
MHWSTIGREQLAMVRTSLEAHIAGIGQKHLAAPT